MIAVDLELAGEGIKYCQLHTDLFSIQKTFPPIQRAGRFYLFHMENQYIVKQNKKLRLGFTTGSCCAAAAKAAAIMAFTGENVNQVELMTPKGILLKLKVHDPKITKEYTSCKIQKDAGDDPDVTNQIYIHVRLEKCEKDQHHAAQRIFREQQTNHLGAVVYITGGNGVGVVTKPGLEQPVGSYAINKIPRKMIRDAVAEVCEEFDYCQGMLVSIEIPEGVKVAQKTFNQRLGIKGGISILGTSGIVEPMSESALIESIRSELRVIKAQKKQYVVISPGNYGEQFIKNHLNFSLDQAVKCSNFIGLTIDAAVECGFDGILFVSHIGKFIKVAGGIMDTHSKNADARMELFAANAAIAGAPLSLIQSILQSTTTEEVIGKLKDEDMLLPTMEQVMEKIHFYLKNRCGEALEIEALVFSNEYGELGRTKHAEILLDRIKNGGLSEKYER